MNNEAPKLTRLLSVDSFHLVPNDEKMSRCKLEWSIMILSEPFLS